MSEKADVVRFKDPGLSNEVVIVANAEIHDERTSTLVNSQDKLAALFAGGR
jgi:hypothetical protein